MSAATIRAYLGGSFNPPHLGHLAMAWSVANQLGCQTYLMPSHNPLKHKADDSRFALLKLATQEYERKHHVPLHIEWLEIDSMRYPTYTLDTLQTLKTNHPNDTLVFILGQDSFENIGNWKGGFELLHHCHLWVFGRDGKQPKGEFCRLDDIHQNKQGKIYWDTTNIPSISSTQIRNLLNTLWQQQSNIDEFYQCLGHFLPICVIDEIIHHKLYQI